MIFSLIEYSLAVIFVILAVFVGWQIICIFTLKIANPILTGLGGKAIAIQSCRNSLSLLDSFSHWVNGIDIHVPPLPEIDINFSPNTNLILMLILMAAALMLALTLLNELLKRIDFAAIWDTILKIFAGIGFRSIFKGKGWKHGGKLPRQTELKGLQPSSIFISYRREDSPYAVGQIYKDLTDYFGKETVFMDVNSIPPGTDFPERLKEAVRNCKVLLAVIGKKWLRKDQKTSRSRTKSRIDFVRLEIELALNNNIPVIPLLVQGRSFPNINELPASLKKLPDQNGLQIRSGRDFQRDMTDLIKAVESILKNKK